MLITLAVLLKSKSSICSYPNPMPSTEILLQGPKNNRQKQNSLAEIASAVRRPWRNFPRLLFVYILAMGQLGRPSTCFAWVSTILSILKRLYLANFGTDLHFMHIFRIGRVWGVHWLEIYADSFQFLNPDNPFNEKSPWKASVKSFPIMGTPFP